MKNFPGKYFYFVFGDIDVIPKNCVEITFAHAEIQSRSATLSASIFMTRK